MESKGDDRKEKDKWKEKLLLEKLNGEHFDKILNSNGTVLEEAEFEVLALPFFLGKNDENFKDKFREIFPDKNSLFKEG